MSYLDEYGLARYDGLLRNWVTFKSGTVDGIDPLLNWQKTETAGAVTCYPLPAAPLDPVINFSFTETGPAEGTKAPDNPSTITGVTQAKVTRSGKNLLKLKSVGTETSNGLTLVRNEDGTCVLSGTATANTFFYINTAPWAQTKAGATYTLSGCPAGGSVSSYRLAGIATVSGTTYYLIDYGSTFTFSRNFDAKWQLYIYVVSGTAITTPITFKPQLELGSAATAFEPYSGTDYTIDFGGTFYGGNVDLSAGTMTVTQSFLTLDSATGWSAASTSYTYKTIQPAAVPITNQNMSLFKCSHFDLSTETSTANMPVNSFIARADRFVIIKTDGLSLEDFKSWLDAQKLAGTPVVVTYPIAIPFTVFLTPTQIYSLSQPDPYTPRINTVYSDQVSVQVGYPKSPQATATELTNAIMSLGSNL